MKSAFVLISRHFLCMCWRENSLFYPNLFTLQHLNPKILFLYFRIIHLFTFDQLSSYHHFNSEIQHKFSCADRMTIFSGVKLSFSFFKVFYLWSSLFLSTYHRCHSLSSCDSSFIISASSLLPSFSLPTPTRNQKQRLIRRSYQRKTCHGICAIVNQLLSLRLAISNLHISHFIL